MFCSNCGCKNDDNSMFCKNCESKLKEVNIEKEENSKTAQVNLEIELLKVKKIEDKVEMINIDENGKITLDSLYDLIENQESNF